MYIKHMKLVSSQEKQDIKGFSSINHGPLVLTGSKEAFFYYLYKYQWPLGLSDHQKLFQAFQSIKINDSRNQNTPCQACSHKVICLVTSHNENNYHWPKEICPLIKAYRITIPDKYLKDKKVTGNKLRFVYENKCSLCALKDCCNNYPLILRMLCNNYTEKSTLFEIAKKKILENWPSLDDFLAALSLGWKEVYFRPPDAKRKRKYKIAFIHPNLEAELIQDYYPFKLYKNPVSLETLGIILPDKHHSLIPKDNLMSSWVLWALLKEELEIHRNSPYQRGLGGIYILRHHNFLLSLYLDPEDHPVLVTANSRYKYQTDFSDLGELGWKFSWPPLTLLKFFR